MSYVHMVVVRRNRLRLARVHFRRVVAVLNNVSVVETERLLDAGYVFVDVDRGIVVNGQSAVAIPRLRNMYVLDG